MTWRTRSSRALVAGAAVLAGLAMTACVASTTDPEATDTAGQAVAGQVCCADATVSGSALNGVSTTYNGWDVAFVEWLAPHDAVASQMAELAPTHSSDPAVKALAAKIDAVTPTRYLEITRLAAAWSKPIPSTDPNAATGHDHGGAGKSEAGDADTLVPLKGSKFDKEFLSIMLAHHQAAMPYAKSTIADGTSPQARAMARTLMSVQTAQIAQMRLLQKKLQQPRAKV